MPTQTATFAAGCFWGVEAEFRALPGVTRTTAGYSGGGVDELSPQLDDFATEAVEVEFDSDAISYEQLLSTFFSTHDPTTRNRQGWDIGSQYRSAIFTHGEEQARAAVTARDARQAETRREIVTEIAPAQKFWPAEDYHQQYLEKRGQASCAVSLSAA